MLWIIIKYQNFKDRWHLTFYSDDSQQGDMIAAISLTLILIKVQLPCFGVSGDATITGD